jgi:hypothetical protein
VRQGYIHQLLNSCKAVGMCWGCGAALAVDLDEDYTSRVDCGGPSDLDICTSEAFQRGICFRNSRVAFGELCTPLYICSK